MRSKKLSTSIALLFSLYIFLFIGEIQARKLQQIHCSSSCGDIKNISYPFRLKGDPAGCGDADYELSCQSDKTILELYSAKYYVKRISYDEHSVTVVDVNLANGSCRLPPKSLSMRELYNDPYSLYPYSLYPYDYNLSHYVRCSSNISDPHYTILPCLSGNQSYHYVTVFADSIYDLPKSCSVISNFPINPIYVEHLSDKATWELLLSGLDLEWSVECRDCTSAGKYCYADPESSEHVYRCGGYGYYYYYSGRGLEILLFLPALLLRVISGPLEFLPILLWFFYRVIYETIDPIQFSLWINHVIDVTIDPIQFSNWYQILLGGFLLLAALLIARFILVMFLVVFLIHKYKTTKKTVDNVEKFLHNQQSLMPKRYSYIEIIAITNHFRDKLGQGGFGSVYQGQLLNGSLVAVKVLANSKFSGEEFINEVSTIGRIHHANVVQLMGFCSEGSKRALVYEYMPNGSLDRHIFLKKGGSQSFSWEKLHEIALGTARGIEYLHNGCDVCILHFDIKPHNILLNRNFIPKVADFGLAKFYPKENDFICVSATRGTIGYVAPELISRNFGAISCKSDIYSFGMLLLEMVGGRRNSFAKATRSSKAYFPSWVYDQIIEGRDLELPYVGEIEAAVARKLCIIGFWCIQVKPADRPSITKVVEMLEGSIDDLQMPPKPFFSSSTQCNSIREIQSDSSTELLDYSESIEDCSYTDHVNDA